MDTGTSLSSLADWWLVRDDGLVGWLGLVLGPWCVSVIIRWWFEVVCISDCSVTCRAGCRLGKEKVDVLTTIGSHVCLSFVTVRAPYYLFFENEAKDLSFSFIKKRARIAWLIGGKLGYNRYNPTHWPTSPPTWNTWLQKKKDNRRGVAIVTGFTVELHHRG